jgi:hypothetical protein
MPDRKLRLAINRQLIGKNEAGRKDLFVYGWENVEVTLAKLAAAVTEGIAFTAQLTGKRKAANFLASDVVSADIDRGMTIEQALDHPIVKQHAALIFTTSSHTPTAHRFRIVFVTPRTITDAREMRALARSLALRLGGDLAATDATRISYGNRGAQTWLVDGELSIELLDELIAQSINPPVTNRAAGGVLAGVRSALRLDPSQLIRLADGIVLPFSKVPPKSQVHCPFHADEHASAFICTSERGVNGLRCSTCVGTYWPPGGEDDVDFHHFDRVVRQVREYFERHRDYGPLGILLNMSAPRVGLLGCNIDSNGRDPAPPKLFPGLTLIKSPKGSGKTAALKRLITDSATTLLVGHRRALIRQTCKRLALSCYLDPEGDYGRLGVCLDSLDIIPRARRYSVVILDESEPLLAHFLADTIDQRQGGGRESLFKNFCTIVSRAKYVVALDADLGWVTFNTLTRMMAPALPDPVQGDLFDQNRAAVRLWLNETKPGRGKTVQVFRSKQHLIADLMQAAADGKRIFVTANSKTLINDIAAMIADRLPRLRQIVITADTVAGEAQKAFLENAQEQALNYDAMLTSPAVGTGVDITFPGRAQLIDAVFAFGEANITTHLDFDQQLARVRDPGAVRVWINPRRFHYETNVDAVRRELLENAIFKCLLIDHNGPGGTARYVEDDPLIEMAAMIISQQRASKNALRDHFIEHKHEQGFLVEFVEPTDEARATGKELLEVGKRLGHEKYVQRLLAAPPLRGHDFMRVSNAIEGGQVVADDEWWSCQRDKIELFYRRPVTADLIARDARGRWRQRIMLLEAVERAAAGRAPNRARISNLGAAERAATGLILNRARAMNLEATEQTGAGRNTDRALEPLDRRLKFLRDIDDPPIAIARLLQLTPVMRNAAWNADAVFDGDQLAAFARFAMDNKAALENVLGIEIRRDVAIKPMSQLKSVLSLIGLDIAKAGATKIAERKTYRYRLDGEALQRAKAVLTARERKTAWRFMAELHGWADDDANPDHESSDDAA